MFTPMKELVSVRPLKGHHIYKHLVRYPDGDKRRSKGFKLKREAEAWAAKKRKELTERGTADASITKDERAAVIRFRNEAAKIDGFDGTLADAVDHYLEHLNRSLKPYTCEHVTDLLIDHMHKMQLSKVHIDGTRSNLKRFNAEYGDRMARDITAEIIQDYLDHLGRAPTTVKNARLALSGLFSHAIKVKAADKHPVAAVELAKTKNKKPGILKPEELAAYLAAASDRVVPAIALSFFAGIRRAEIERLDWANIDFDEGDIYIPEDVAKAEKERWVDMCDTLKAWLLPHRLNKGAVVQSPQIHRTDMVKARKLAGIKWPKNAGRHSFATYHLGKHMHAGETAFQLGHPNPTMLEKHYRSTVRSVKKLADAYWNILPDQVANITNIKAQ